MASQLGHAAADIGLDNFDTLNHSWAGTGNVSLSATTCIYAFAGNKTRAYAVLAEQINGPANSFVLTSTDAASAQLPLNLEFDSNPPVSTLDLESGMDFTGPYPGAFSGGCNNATLTWNFSAFDLQSAPAGTYTASESGLTFSAAWINNNNKGDSIPLGFTMTIPPLVAISHLDDLDVAYDGISNVVPPTQESYCAWSNSGSYSITASSTTTPVNDSASFAVSNGNNTIPYTLLLAGGLNPANGTVVSNGGTVGPITVNNQGRDCNGTDNSSLQVEFDAGDINSAPQGRYGATVVLRVQAE